MQLLAEKFTKLDQIKAANNIQSHGQQDKKKTISVQLLQDKIMKLNKIKEAHNITAQGWQEMMMFL